ncbi:hypothetical protein LS72_009270 [Helicobacter apodemus]|uniref:Uncharacterized protein n=1 Tax=Helicobacter apodemus TaxID=135569 RepID=A0A4U8UE56_9HELI|nr:hypothetical protein [Helicobacter apodemus]TLE13995.1 hypothetical protein LS72_009270 [Helicobacter apodemus]
MQQKDWVLVIIFLSIGLIFISLFFIFFFYKNTQPQKKQEKMPNAKEILELLRQKENTLESLHQYSSLAKIHHTSYFQENENFDLEFVSILASHKNVNAKLVLEIEKYFKSINPNRKELLDKALESGLNKR